jgi:nucleoside-diphosphate-sugar epimerase
LVRPQADTTLLEQWGVEVIRGDLTEATAVRSALEGADVVVHCAAKVGDWGPLDEYRRVNVEGLRALCDAALSHTLHRFVHISTLGVYAARHHYGTDESEPLPERHIDGYTQSKVEAERLVLQYHRKQQLPVVILRPGFIYGPRDRTLLPRLIERLRERSILYIAAGRYALNTTYVGNLVHAIISAIEAPTEAVVGEIFNITDGEFVSKRMFFETVADHLGLPRPRSFPLIPLWLARLLAHWRENKFRRQNRPYPPRLTQAQLKFAGLNLDFSIAKARQILGYHPPTCFQEGMRITLEWFQKHSASLQANILQDHHTTRSANA